MHAQVRRLREVSNRQRLTSRRERDRQSYSWRSCNVCGITVAYVATLARVIKVLFARTGNVRTGAGEIPCTCTCTCALTCLHLALHSMQRSIRGGREPPSRDTPIRLYTAHCVFANPQAFLSFFGIDRTGPPPRPCSDVPSCGIPS